MKRDLGYKLTILVLFLVIVLQWIYIIQSRPRKAPLVVRPKPLVALKGKIAIVIDDWGYNLQNLPIIEQVHFPLTVSILPNLGYSGEVSRQLHARGFEVILHLPMEPHEKYRLEKNTIMVSFSEGEIKNIIEHDLGNIIYAKGVSNHMGSLATEDTRVMGVVFKELKKRRLYFLDSVVSGKSICADLAQKMKLSFTRRDVFLDNVETPEYIKDQIRKLKLRSRMKGEAVGIGHDRRITLQVLREMMPEMEKEGYRFVFISDLVKQ